MFGGKGEKAFLNNKQSEKMQLNKNIYHHRHIALLIQETLANPGKCKTENYAMTRNHGESFSKQKTVDFHEETYSAFYGLNKKNSILSRAVLFLFWQNIK